MANVKTILVVAGVGVVTTLAVRKWIKMSEDERVEFGKKLAPILIGGGVAGLVGLIYSDNKTIHNRYNFDDYIIYNKEVDTILLEEGAVTASAGEDKGGLSATSYKRDGENLTYTVYTRVNPDLKKHTCYCCDKKCFDVTKWEYDKARIGMTVREWRG